MNDLILHLWLPGGCLHVCPLCDWAESEWYTYCPLCGSKIVYSGGFMLE